MDGLGGLKQAAELFIQVRRGLEALNKGFEKRPASEQAGDLGVSSAAWQRMSEAMALGWALSAERRGGFAAMPIQENAIGAPRQRPW